jgi:outer membrane protein assembly factor BamB
MLQKLIKQMQKKEHLSRAITGILMLIFIVSVTAQDWPQWRGSMRDGKVLGFICPEVWPSELEKGWEIEVGLGDSSPALVGNRLYLFTEQEEEEVTLCLDAASGKELWSDHYTPQLQPGIYNDPFRFQHPGPRSSPCVTEGKVITLGVVGVLSCLDARTGRVIWRNTEYTKKVPKFFTAMSPLVVDGLCIAHLGGSDEGIILALDLNSGQKVWEWNGDGPAYASPLVVTIEGSKQIVMQTEKSLLGLAAKDGRQLWKIDTPVNRNSYYNAATPIVNDHTIFYTGQELGTRAVRIKKTGSGYTITELWSNEETGTVFNTPVLQKDHLYGLNKKRHFFCIDARTGLTRWMDEGRNDSYGAIINAGEVLLALPGNSEFIAFSPGGDSYQELARYKVADTPTFAHPIVAGNRIYVKAKETLSLWIIR